MSVSQEYVCRANVGGEDKAWHCILPPGFVGGRTGITGSPNDLGRGAPINILDSDRPYESKRGGYDGGRDDLVAQLGAIPTVHPDWTVRCRNIKRPTGSGLKVPVSNADRDDPAVAKEQDPELGTILARVPWDGIATHCTISRGAAKM